MLLAFLVHLVRLDPLDPPVREEREVCLDPRVFLDHLDRLASLAHQVFKESLGKLDPKVPRDPKVTVVSLVSRDFQVPLVQLDKRDLKVRLGRMESQELKVAEDSLELMAPLVKWAILDPWDQEDLLEKRANEVLLENWVLLVLLDLLVKALAWTWLL